MNAKELGSTAEFEQMENKRTNQKDVAAIQGIS